MNKTNLIRTLLLNRKNPNPADPAPWDRYIPESFNPVRLSNDLERVRLALLSAPDAGDWWDVTYRVEGLITLVDQSRFSHLKDVDPRVTPRRSDPTLYGFGYDLKAETTSAENTVSAALALKTSDVAFPVRRRWMLTITSPTQITVLDSNSGTSTVAPIGPNDPFITLNPDVLFTLDYTAAIVGSRWTVTAVIQPKDTVSKSSASIVSLGATVSKLFEQGSDLGRIYSETRFTEDKLVTAILAYVKKVEALIM